MASSLMACLVLAVALATTVTAQSEFNFATPEYVATYEGQIQPLVLEITRTGSLSTAANVTLTAYEANDNYRRQWFNNIEFLVGEAKRTLNLGVIDDESVVPDKIYFFIISLASLGTSVGSRSRVVVSYADNDGPKLFNCNAGEQCQNGGVCNTQSGLCDCTMSTFADCRVKISDLNAQMCANMTCGRAGVCVTDGLGGTKCVCQPGYAGETCQLQQRYNVQCFSNRMCLNVDPPPGYTGSRYIRDKAGIAECTLSAVTPQAIATDGLPNTWTGSYLCLPHEHFQCGNVLVTTEPDGNTTRTREVIIRQNMLRTKHDIRFFAHCKYDYRGVLYIEQNNVNTGSGLRFVNATDYVSPASIFIVNIQTGNQVTLSTVDVGDEVCFALVLDQGFAAFRLDSVVADDTLAEPETYEVLQNGCPNRTSTNVVSRLPWLPNALDRRLIYFCIHAFLFERSSKVGLRLQTALCATNPAECVPFTCSNNGPSFGRKKREAIVTETTRVLVTSFNVRDPRENIPSNSDALILTAKPECKLSTPIIAALAVLAVVAAVLLFALVLMVVRATRSRDK